MIVTRRRRSIVLKDADWKLEGCVDFIKSGFIIAVAVVLAGSPVRAQDPREDSEKSDTPKRLFGVLPNYRTTDGSIPFMPISPRQKLTIATHDSFDWPTFVLAGFLTGISQARSAYPYGGGMHGFTNRYVRSAADQITGNMMTEGFVPVLLHQDPRYFRPGEGKKLRRLGSALGQILVARSDSGRRMPNLAEFLGNGIAVGISSSYSPDLNSWPRRGEKLMIMISTDAVANVIKEFGPDIRQKLFNHSEPR
jgi:hypothetical protein